MYTGKGGGEARVKRSVEGKGGGERGARGGRACVLVPLKFAGFTWPSRQRSRHGEATDIYSELNIEQENKASNFQTMMFMNDNCSVVVVSFTL